jgi:hypothetical protein
MKTIHILTISTLLFLCSCSEEIKKQDFGSFLSEPCMILNYEQDNTIEGEYLRVSEINFQDSTIIVSIPGDFFIDHSNLSHWLIGWGNDVPLYDAGMENLRTISKIDLSKKAIGLGGIVRGSGLPKKDQRIVFWNINPSGFINKNRRPVIDPSVWPDFAGKSISFGSVEFDSILNKWIIHVNECDTSSIQIYAAMSGDLINWEPANNGAPILKAADFKTCSWAGRDRTNSVSQTPFVSDIVRSRNKWFLFLDGYSIDGKRHIGMAVSENSLLGPYKIFNDPAISPGNEGDWNDEACFYAKVKRHKDGFIMFYDGRNKAGTERIGMATSGDLITWTNSLNNPVIDQHSGWRSSPGTTEPAYIEIRQDTVILMIAGVKTFKMGAWHHYVTKRMYRDRSGNVDDAQLGIYISIDGGNTFAAHPNNPVFTNDYSSPYENEHLGGNFRLIVTDSVEYIFYQAKSVMRGLHYNIMMRARKK